MIRYLTEETYELVDAIENDDPDEVCEELGDVLFQILFIAVMFQEMGHFDLTDIIQLNSEKMIRRHPHVFGSETVNGAEDVKIRWQQIKMKEKNRISKTSALESFSVRLPALMRAYKFSEIATKMESYWNDTSAMMEHTEKEWLEFKCALESEDPNRLKLKFGNLLFTLVKIARFYNFHPETALTTSIKQFEKQFKHLEKIISEKEGTIDTFEGDALKKLWEDFKKTGE